MSGICGLVLKELRDEVERGHLDPMVQALAFRQGGEPLTYRNGGVGFGTLRVPWYQSGIAEAKLHGHAVALTFHGSLYSIRDRGQNEEKGVAVAHTLLQYYLEQGIKFLERLRGEFVIAIWDGGSETLSLAIDRFRVQPLFYCEDHQKILFGSRMQSLLACPLPSERTIYVPSLVDIMAFSAISTPATIFREVRKLPPGHVLTHRSGASVVTRYWDINFLNPARSSEEELGEQLKARFSDAVAVRVDEDGTGPHLGAFLSGGVDSSTVIGILTQVTKAPVKSFTIGFSEEQFNELSYARISAKHFGSDHYEYIVTPKDAFNLIPVLMESFDEPFANASAIPTYYCAQLARQHGVSVLYAGDGGDELFGGNERYSTQRLFEYWTRVPYWLREGLVRPLVKAGAATRLSVFEKAMKYIQRASIPYPDRITSYGLFNTLPLSQLFEADVLKSLGNEYSPYESVRAHYFEAPAVEELDRQLYIDLKMTISDNDLFKVTRMTQAAGVAVRYPFLDQDVVDCAAAIPAKIKMRGRVLRSFYKKAYGDLLPIEVRTKTKHGFGLPIPVWLQSDKDLNEMMRELVLGSRTTQRGLFRRDALEQFVRLHQTDSASYYGAILWNVMILELWYRKNVDRSAVSC
jgi:asparagine synthase (glutamine-hydrolysing)